MRSGGVGSPALGIRLPCRIPLTILARAPLHLPCPCFGELLIGLCYIHKAVGVPALGIRVGYGIRLPRPCALLPYVLQGRERAEYGSSLPTCPLGFRLGYKGSLDLWPRYRFPYPYRVAPAGEASRLALGALLSVLCPRAFIGLSYLLGQVTLPKLPRPARSPAVSDRDHEGFGFRLTLSRMPSLRASL